MLRKDACLSVLAVLSTALILLRLFLPPLFHISFFRWSNSLCVAFLIFRSPFPIPVFYFVPSNLLNFIVRILCSLSGWILCSLSINTKILLFDILVFVTFYCCFSLPRICATQNRRNRRSRLLSWQGRYLSLPPAPTATYILLQ